MPEPIKIVGIGGTTRPNSSSERLIRLVLDKCAELGAETQLFGGEKLTGLPHYAPELPERSTQQQELLQAVRAADGLVIATPGYHGGVSGLVKNAIDLLEDTRLDTGRSYLDGCPVGLIVCAAGWQATGITLSSMRDIVFALRGWPTPIGLTVNSVAQPPFDAAGEIVDKNLEAMASAQAGQLVSRSRAMHGNNPALCDKDVAGQPANASPSA